MANKPEVDETSPETNVSGAAATENLAEALAEVIAESHEEAVEQAEVSAIVANGALAATERQEDDIDYLSERLNEESETWQNEVARVSTEHRQTHQLLQEQISQLTSQVSELASLMMAQAQSKISTPESSISSETPETLEPETLPEPENSQSGGVESPAAPPAKRVRRWI